MHVSTHALQYVYHIFYILLHNINNGFIQGGEVFPPSHRFQTKFTSTTASSYAQNNLSISHIFKINLNTTKISANFPLLC